MDNLLVLIVEDETLIQLDLETCLQEGGFETATASSGKEALTKIDASPLRALVTDINLGKGPTGWDVARRARELTPTLPVVYVTTVSSDEWRANGVPDSILIGKPFVHAQILTAVSQLVTAASSLSAST